MSTFKEAHSVFSDLRDKANAIARSLREQEQTAVSRSQRLTQETTDEIASALMRKFDTAPPTFSSPLLSSLSMSEWADLRGYHRALRVKIDAFDKNGAESLSAALSQKIQAVDTAARRAETAISDNPARAVAKQFGLESDEKAAYAKPGFFQAFFAPARQRQVWKAVEAFEKKTGADFWTRLQELEAQEQICKQCSVDREDLKKQRTAAQDGLARRQSWETAYKTEIQLRPEWARVVSSKIMSHPPLAFREMATELDAGHLSKWESARAGAALSKRMAGVLGQYGSAANGIADNLDTPISNLARAKRNGAGSHRFKGDLDKIKTDLETALAQFETLSGSASSAQSALDQASRAAHSASREALFANSYPSSSTQSSSEPDNGMWLLTWILMTNSQHSLALTQAMGMPPVPADFGNGWAAAIDSRAAGAAFSAPFSPAFGLGSANDSLRAGAADAAQAASSAAELPAFHMPAASFDASAPAFDFTMPGQDFSMPAMDFQMPVVDMPAVTFDMPSVSFEMPSVSVDIPSMDFSSSSTSFDAGFSSPSSDGWS